jgi:hypothetical protein
MRSSFTRVLSVSLAALGRASQYFRTAVPKFEFVRYSPEPNTGKSGWTKRLGTTNGERTWK